MVARRAGVLGVRVSMIAVAGALSLGCGGSIAPIPGDDAATTNLGNDAGTTNLGNDAAATNPASCPASYAEAEATGPCETNGEQCYYATGNCICSIITGGPATGAAPPTNPSWGCIPLAPGCPTFPPTIGTSCTPSSTPCAFDCEEFPDRSLVQDCDYGECTFVGMACIDGIWHSGANVECPL
jgi:hypothetical protein